MVTLPKIPAVDDAHPRALVQRGRVRRVLGIDVQHHARESATGERLERATEESAADPAPAKRRKDAEFVHPATVTEDTRGEGADRLPSLGRQQPQRRVEA